jgi:hypothetical protein
MAQGTKAVGATPPPFFVAPMAVAATELRWIHSALKLVLALALALPLLASARSW